MDKSMLSALQADLAVKQAEVERIAAAFPHEDGKFAIPADMHRDYVTAVKAATEVKSVIDAAASAAEIAGYLQAPAGGSAAAMDAGSRILAAGNEVKSFADYFIESKSFQEAKAAGAFREGRTESPRMHAEIEGKSIYNFSGGTATVQTLGSAEHVGIQEQAKRKWHVRDLFPKSSTSAAVLYGVRETGWLNAAKQVNQKYAADGIAAATGNDATDVWGRAPKSNITLTPVMFPVAGIKHALDAHKYILNDESRLRTFLNTRMLDGVKYAEDDALLHSVGTGEQITGLFNTPGVQSYTGLSSDQYDVQVRRAITKAMLAEYDPTGLVLSPTMWENIEVEEGTDGHLRVATAVAIGSEKRIWRLNVVPTTAMQDTKFLVGAFGMGAQLHDREQVSVSVSTEHASNYTDGVVTFLAEERVALEVVRPESFVVGSWTTPA